MSKRVVDQVDIKKNSVTIYFYYIRYPGRLDLAIAVRYFLLSLSLSMDNILVFFFNK